ncbi:MAG: DUF2914 domain-containing protein [Patescibacteria group bacterium]|nr:DUF2914 domain-containing protein [Patescibacteria group bacterium]
MAKKSRIRRKIDKKVQNQVERTKGWLERNDKYLSISFFSLGLIIDRLTLTRVDLLFDNLVLITYLCLAILGIVLLYRGKTLKYKKPESRFVKISKYVPFLMQYAFGGLFSGFIIFYGKSASWAVSWIFLFILFAFFVGNERFRQKYKRVDFQISILFVAFFAFLIFFIPVVIKEMGVWVFVLSGVLSLLLTYILIYSLSRFIFKIKTERRVKIAKSILSIFIVFNALYFFNIIPPIPLSLQEIGIYDYIYKDTAGEYVLIEKNLPWYSFGNYLLKIPEGRVYVYQSIFAPTNLDTDIYNIWQKFDESKKRWVSVSKVHFPLIGGREEGYRGYSFMVNITEGFWRVDVKTKEGLVVGRIRFEVLKK